jgi:hypothetical protein
VIRELCGNLTEERCMVIGSDRLAEPIVGGAE